MECGWEGLIALFCFNSLLLHPHGPLYTNYYPVACTLLPSHCNPADSKTICPARKVYTWIGYMCASHGKAGGGLCFAILWRRLKRLDIYGVDFVAR